VSQKKLSSFLYSLETVRFLGSLALSRSEKRKTREPKLASCQIRLLFHHFPQPPPKPKPPPQPPPTGSRMARVPLLPALTFAALLVLLLLAFLDLPVPATGDG
jgi:hypothetical protein